MPFLSKITKISEYKDTDYLITRDDTDILKAKKLYCHIQTIRKFKRADSNPDDVDNPNVLEEIEFEAECGELIGICGQVGHGKTSFFNAILGELRLSAANRDVIGSSKGQEIKKLTFDQKPSASEDMRFNTNMPHVYLGSSVAYFS